MSRTPTPQATAADLSQPVDTAMPEVATAAVRRADAPSGAAETTPGPTSAPTRAAVRLTEAQRDSIERLRDSLLTKFDFHEDEIRGGGWYYHARQRPEDAFARIYLRAAVNHAGRVYLVSHYYRSGWIFHDRVVARIGDRVIETAPAPSGNIDRQVGQAGVWEMVTFSGERDGGLLDAIAAADPATSTIRIRLSGDRIHDYVLHEDDHQAIREAVALARTLRQVGQ